MLPDADALELFAKDSANKQNLDNFLGKFLPNRFADFFTANSFQNKPLYRLNGSEIEKVADNLNNWQVSFNETEGYHKAEVTLGGVETDEISSQTMESKRVSGLFFIGEILDVTGWLGGYNFQWAWSSAFAAGNSL